MRLILTLLLISTSQAFDLKSWASPGSDQVNLCWPAVENADYYEVYAGRTFQGSYEWSNTVSGNDAVHMRPVLPGREFIFLVAYTADHQVIETSDTIGCFYLRNSTFPPGVERSVPFALGKLEYLDRTTETGCDFSADNSTRPSDIIGVQLVSGAFGNADRVVRQDGGSAAFRTAPNGAWLGTLESGAAMILGRAYVFATIQNSHAPIITGRANSNFSPDGMITITGGLAAVSTPIGFPIFDATPVSALGLETSGFSRGNPVTGDGLMEQGTGRLAILTSQGQWRGTLDYCYPERAYFITNRPHSNGTWVYHFSSVGLP